MYSIHSKNKKLPHSLKVVDVKDLRTAKCVKMWLWVSKAKCVKMWLWVSKAKCVKMWLWVSKAKLFVKYSHSRKFNFLCKLNFLEMIGLLQMLMKTWPHSVVVDITRFNAVMSQYLLIICFFILICLLYYSFYLPLIKSENCINSVTSFHYLFIVEIYIKFISYYKCHYMHKSLLCVLLWKCLNRQLLTMLHNISPKTEYSLVTMRYCQTILHHKKEYIYMVVVFIKSFLKQHY